MGESCRLIVTAPAFQGLRSGFITAWPAIQEVLRKHLKTVNSHFEFHRECMSSGLPYHFPFLFDSPAAEALANDLRGAGCEARIVPSND